MRVWLVEADSSLRRKLSQAIQRLGESIALTGCFGSPGEAISALEGTQFDVALIDLEIPEMPGEALIAMLRAARPKAALLAWANRFDDAAIFGALRAGAIGYLSKDSSIGAIADALETAVKGGSPMSPTIGRRLVQFFHSDPTGSSFGATISNSSASDFGSGTSAFRLTPRETQVLELLCSGISYREVAVNLRITIGTVQSHVKKVYEKLGVGSKAEAVRIALESRLVRMRRRVLQ